MNAIWPTHHEIAMAKGRLTRAYIVVQIDAEKHLTVVISRLAVLSNRRNGTDASTCVISNVVTGSIQETLIT